MTFESVAKSISTWVDEGIVAGASIAVEYRGEVVAEHHVGQAIPGVRVDDQTLFGLASLSKPITAAAFMTLVDDGVVELDTPVIDVLPDFGAEVDPLNANAMLEAQRDEITFRMLLAHTSGLPENPGPELYDPSTLPSREDQTDAMLRTPLISAPREVLRYSNVGPGITARAAEELLGRNYLEIVRERVLVPMDLSGIVMNPDDDQVQRIATLQDPANPGTAWETYNSAWWRECAVPWGGYYGTTTDMLRFATSFLPGKQSVLSTNARREMTTDQVRGLEGGVNSMHAHWVPGYWGLGWEVKGTKQRHWTGTRTSEHTWVHWGFAGTLCWVDPTRGLGVAVFANRSVSSGWMFRPQRWAQLSDALCDVADGLE